MLHLRILTTDKVVFDSTADEITLPTELGMIGVFANHSPLVTIVRPGQMTVKKEGEILTYFISGGILEARPGSQVVILAISVEIASEINLIDAKDAVQLAQNDLETAKKSLELTEHLQRKLAAARARVVVAENQPGTKK